MRQLTAAENRSTGGWHYVSLSSRGGHPIGDCAGHAPHDTEAEARECYSASRRKRVKLDGKCRWTTCSQPECDEPADRVASVEGDAYAFAAFCLPHCTLENAIKRMGLNGPAGDSWES